VNTGLISKRVYATERFGKLSGIFGMHIRIRVRRALMRSNEAIFDAATFHVRQTRFGQRGRFLVSRFTTSEVAQKALSVGATTLARRVCFAKK
jgi:hypothetical protein